ncbi:hypothetical protein HUT19_13305 [Streptomyces sp. NA02950]|uniref:hypothetical protein n=1 Tax=Streptomyces sp. NA02950 TaxID=2742137 RepID=UPI0015927D87|nr:hypothetical protein [Streptomyces sp. NA02950]QKV92606.1 hypothetical protein HUT19_13305 [Streptomyces sp. NA02950]
MTAAVPPLPKIESLVESLEQLVLLPPGQRGPAPQILLTQLTEATNAERIADGLCARFSAGGRARIPFAQVAGKIKGPPRERVGKTFQKIEEELVRNRPGGFGKLRLSQFRLMCAVVEADLTRPQVDAQPKELRNQIYEARCSSSAVLRALETMSGGEEPPPGIPGTAWYWLRRPVFGLLPRWWYGRRHHRRMTRQGGWYAKWAELPDKGADFYADAVRLTAGAEAAAGPEGRALIVDALLRALLADVERAFRHPRLSPWGRRRRHRVVLVLPQFPGAGSDAGLLLERFPGAVEHTGCTGAMLVAVVPRDEQRTESFAEAAITLKSWIGSTGTGGARVVRVGVESHPDDPDAARWLVRYPETPVGRARSDAAPRVEAASAGVAGIIALALLGVYGVAWVTAKSDTACLGEGGASASASPAGSGGPATRPPDRSPQEVYDDIRTAIGKENEKADRAARDGAVVRTVVYLGVPVTADDWETAKYSGAIPELRGIALAQKEINRQAAQQKESEVWLKIRPMDAGQRFAKAPAIAERLVREVGRGGSTAGGEQILGVVGLGQSRKDTLRTRDILADGGLPMIGTSATAEQMQGSAMYRQIPPDNGREARIAAEFARHGNIVRTRPGECAPAEKAVVIGDPHDIYSANLSERFTEEFKGARQIWYPLGDASASPPSGVNDGGDEWVSSPPQMATSICRRLTEEPRTVVYWAARANEFENFLNAFDEGTTCKGRVTVLGGNDLTNAVVEEQRPTERHSGLRLYYAAQALPKDDPPNVMGIAFRRQYAQAYGDDLWSNDGRAPLAWDALRVLSEGINAAYRNAGTAPFGRATVQFALEEGVGGTDGVRGATGSLVFAENRKVPRNKRLLMLYDRAGASPAVALECGIRDSGVEATSWGPDDRFSCPRDRDD